MSSHPEMSPVQQHNSDTLCAHVHKSRSHFATLGAFMLAEIMHSSAMMMHRKNMSVEILLNDQTKITTFVELVVEQFHIRPFPHFCNILMLAAKNFTDFKYNYEVNQGNFAVNLAFWS